MPGRFRVTLRDIAEQVGGEIYGNPDTYITGVAGLTNIREGDIIFIESEKLLNLALKSPAAAVIAPKHTRALRSADAPKPALLAENPRLTFAKVVETFAVQRPAAAGVHPTAVVGEDVTLGRNVTIGAYAYIGRGCRLGDNVIVHPHAFIGDNVTIGDDSLIFPFACIHHEVVIGKRVIVHSGAVIGSDGFGYVQDAATRRHHKIPQIGTVILEDDVEVGANTTIDRATLDATIIGEGTKIDNLVQIGHNCRIGKHCIIVAQVGLCGSTVLEDYVMLMGQVGVQGHITVGEGVWVGGRGVVLSDVPAGAKVSGFPAIPHAENMRVLAASRKLPDLLRTVRHLSKQVEELTRSVEMLQQPKPESQA
ncbi:MAG: UDP-3-O-(3-hydroxymyristoyl)glucosamine N-acyltransferase [Abditibacteriales bacterium]|nr:UDP-3-O-(3-hydroxymyristoyl)glucosamine N-acyltransferase [Abditibacteriales bacterium]MDW8366549.1 UDP-3-O-(3-hydroxymyristoyl)glucosamine N-acyltransferase [Abditibacteriales bacterium]